MTAPRFASPLLVTAAALSLVLGACSDSSAPDAPFDPAGTSADIQAVDQSFESAVAQSYSAVAFDISTAMNGAASAAAGVMPSARVGSRAGATQYAQKVASLYTSASGSGSGSGASLRPSLSAASIPSEYLGKTFEWDVATDQYVVTERSGAPSNGVRFILYSVDPITYRPTEPLVEVGYAQIVSTLTSTSASIHVTLVSNTVTYVDYTLTVSETASGGVITVAGYASNGSDRVNFNLSHYVTGNETDGFTLSLDYLLEVPTRGFRIDMEVTIDGLASETIVATLDFEVQGDHGRVSIDGTVTNDVGSYTIRVNGEIVATVEVTATGHTITGADGHELTAEELDALEEVFAVFAEGFGFFADIFVPIA